MIFFKRKHNFNLYSTLLNLSRNIFFYQKIELEDKFETRIYLMFFHFSIIMLAFKKKYLLIIESIKYFDLKNIKTNIIFFYLEKNGLSDDEFIKKLLSYNIKIDSKGNRKFRIATHSSFKCTDIDKISDIINKIVNKG